MPYCPTTSPFGPIATPTIGSIPTPHTETGLGPIETGNPNGMGMGPGGFPGMGMGPSFPDMPGAGGEHVGGYKTHGY